VNKQFWVKKTVMCGFWGPPMHRSRDTIHAQSLCSLQNGNTLFSPNNIYENSIFVVLKVTKSEQINWGQEFQKRGLFCPFTRW